MPCPQFVVYSPDVQTSQSELVFSVGLWLETVECVTIVVCNLFNFKLFNLMV